MQFTFKPHKIKVHLISFKDIVFTAPYNVVLFSCTYNERVHQYTTYPVIKKGKSIISYIQFSMVGDTIVHINCFVQLIRIH